jgi:phosphoglycerol transferase MdoB-like AlkP superfamily enzyme
VLFSQPNIKRKHPLLKITPQTGIANALKSHGYSTVYFTTHGADFDNVGPFLEANGYDKIVSKADYPPERILSSLGIVDDYLYEYTVDFLDKYNFQDKENAKPFFAAVMTGSDHGPYIIPDYYKPKQKKATRAIVEYVDWSVEKFLKMASKKQWFDNTIFVFVGDHGSSLDKRYDLPLSFIHTPLIMYASKLLGEPKTVNSIGSQLDIYPTIMGMLHLPYVNNTFGIDLLNQKREFTISDADTKFAVLNTQYLYLERENGINSLYEYRSGDVKNYSTMYPQLSSEMKTYGENMFQAAQWLLKSGNTSLKASQ